MTLIIGVVFFVGAFIQTVTGFGFGIIVMSILPIFLTMSDTVAMLLFCAILLCGYVSIKNIRHINFKLITIPLICQLIGVYTGVRIFESTENSMAVRLLGIWLLILSVYSLKFSSKAKLSSNFVTALIVGIISGIMGGFFNISGPPLVLYFSNAVKTRREYIASIHFVSLIGSIFKTSLSYMSFGISNQLNANLPVAIVMTVIGFILGRLVFGKLPFEKIRIIIYVFIMLSGIWYIVS